MLESVVADFLQAEEAGQPQSQQDWIARYPDLADDLKTFFSSRQIVPRLWPIRPLCETPSQMGDYELLEPIARGGMGMVYKARHQRLNRIVALKLILSGHLARRSDVERFHAEAEAAASLDHPNIVPIYEVGQHAGHHYFTMKLITGGSLAEMRSPESGVASQDAARLLFTIARAVHYAHERGILHRDLKPSNILLDTDGRPYISDFGLAKRFEADDSVTGSGAIVGTPLYMAPEQAAGQKQLTTAADIYSLGAILYWLLTGKPAFQASTPLETLRQVQEREPPRLRSLNPAVDCDLETICLKCLEKDPQRRYASAAALADDLDRWLAGENIFARPLSHTERWSRWCRRNPLVATLAAAIVLVALLGLAGVVVQWRHAVVSEQRALASAATAKAKEQEANAQRDKVRAVNEQLEQTLYTAHMNLAQRTWQAGAAERVMELLDRHRPQPEQTDLRGFEWFYLHRLCHSDLLTIQVPALIIHGVAFSPNGTLAGALSDGNVVIWDAQSGRTLRTLSGNGNPTRSVAFSRDGKRLASAHGGFTSDAKTPAPGEVNIWEIETGTKLLSVQHKGPVYAAAFSPDGAFVAGASEAGATIWNWRSGELHRTFPGPSGGRYWALEFSPDGNRLVSGGGHQMMALPPELKVWDIQSNQPTLDLQGHSSFIFSIAISPDGRRLASASWDQTVRTWDLENGRELFAIKRLSGALTSVVFSPDGLRLAIGSHDGIVRICDAHDGQELFTIKGRSGHISSLAFSPDGKRLASARASDAPLRMTDLGTDGNRSSTAKQAAGANYLRPYINVWDAERNQEHLTLHVPLSRELSVAFSPSGDRLFAAGGPFMRLWDTQRWQEIITFESPEVDSQSYLFAGAYSPDGKRLATAGALEINDRGQPKGAIVKTWDSTSGKQLRSLLGHTDFVSDVAFSPDSRRLATASNDSTVRIWDSETGQELLTFRGHTGPPWSVIFSPDGMRVASAGPRANLKVWNPETGEESAPFSITQPGPAYGLAFSPDGKLLAGSALDWTVKIWDTQSGGELHRLNGHVARVVRLAFSPDGSRLASSSADRTIKVWDVVAGEELLSLEGHEGAVASVAFCPDGHRLVSGAVDGMIKIWDATPVSPRNAD